MWKVKSRSNFLLLPFRIYIYIYIIHSLGENFETKWKESSLNFHFEDRNSPPWAIRTSVETLRLIHKKFYRPCKRTKIQGEKKNREEKDCTNYKSFIENLRPDPSDKYSRKNRFDPSNRIVFSPVFSKWSQLFRPAFNFFLYTHIMSSRFFLESNYPPRHDGRKKNALYVSTGWKTKSWNGRIGDIEIANETCVSGHAVRFESPLPSARTDLYYPPSSNYRRTTLSFTCFVTIGKTLWESASTFPNGCNVANISPKVCALLEIVEYNSRYCE